MYIIDINQQNERNRTVQKLHLREVMEFIIDTNEGTQIQMLNLIGDQLNLSTISKARKTLTVSYNGIKNFGNTITFRGKNFVILK